MITLALGRQIFASDAVPGILIKRLKTPLNRLQIVPYNCFNSYATYFEIRKC